MNAGRKVGIVAAAAIVVLLGAVLVIGKVRLGVSGYIIKVQYKFLNDLKVDAPVKYAGGPVVGRVKDIAVDKELVTAVLWIDRQYRIRQDSEFWIFTTGMLGEMYVEVDASPSGTAPYIPEGYVVRGIDPTSTDATLIRLGKIVDALAPIFAKEEVASSIYSMVADLRSASSRIAGLMDKHTGKVDQALDDLEAFSRNLAKMSREIESLMSNMRTLSDPKGGESIQVTLRRFNTTLSSLEEASRTIVGIARKIDQGKGPLGALVNDEKLASDIRAMVKKLKDEPIIVRMKLI